MNYQAKFEYPDPCEEKVIEAKESKAIRPYEKVVVTQKGLDNWRAQFHGFSLDEFPKMRPPQMSEALWAELKKKYVYRTKNTKSPSNADGAAQLKKAGDRDRRATMRGPPLINVSGISTTFD